MNRVLLFFILALCIAMCTSVHAQDEIPVENHFQITEGMYLGGQASTNGYGVNLMYLFSKGFSIRAGYETLKLSADFKFDENDVDYNGDLNYKTGGIYVLGDFHFSKNFYFSAGALLNSFEPQIAGEAASALQYGDISIPAEEVGDFVFIITPGHKISPYGGIGLRSFIGKKKRTVFTFEGGTYYMGSPEIAIETTGLLSPTSDPAHGHAEKLENQVKQYKFYPVIKIGLAFKLF